MSAFNTLEAQEWLRSALVRPWLCVVLGEAREAVQEDTPGPADAPGSTPFTPSTALPGAQGRRLVAQGDASDAIPSLGVQSICHS